jgi:hypothetical protein
MYKLSESSREPDVFKKTIRVSNPEKYVEGKKCIPKLSKIMKKMCGILDKLKFEVEKII